MSNTGQQGFLLMLFTQHLLGNHYSGGVGRNMANHWLSKLETGKDTCILLHESSYMAASRR